MRGRTGAAVAIQPPLNDARPAISPKKVTQNPFFHSPFSSDLNSERVATACAVRRRLPMHSEGGTRYSQQTHSISHAQALNVEEETGGRKARGFSSIPSRTQIQFQSIRPNNKKRRGSTFSSSEFAAATSATSASIKPKEHGNMESLRKGRRGEM